MGSSLRFYRTFAFKQWRNTIPDYRSRSCCLFDFGLSNRRFIVAVSFNRPGVTCVTAIFPELHVLGSRFPDEVVSVTIDKLMHVMASVAVQYWSDAPF